MNMPTPPKRPTKNAVSFGKVKKAEAHRVQIYGTGGIGKTTMAANAPGPVVFVDLDDSLGRLHGKLDNVDELGVVSVDSWKELRDALHAPGWDDVKTIVIDSGTRAEELCTEFVCATIPHEKGVRITGIEDYGYGKGYTYLLEQYTNLLADLDAHCRAGRNVVMVCHECTQNVPNPEGEDWIRYEPRLHEGKASIRKRTKEWADSVLFVGYDVAVDKKTGKGRGSGTRTVWPCELPHCMAKSRTMSDPVALVEGDETIWNAILGRNA